MSLAFYPSCCCNFVLRFDEALHLVPDPPSASLDDALKAVDQSIASLAAKANDKIQLPNLRGAGNPPLIAERGDANASFVMNRVPKTAKVELPGYRQAAKFTLTFDFRELPIDPRTVRSCMVEVHLGTVKPKDFGAGMIKGDVKRTTLNTRTESGDPNPETMLIYGQVDEWKVEHGPEGSEVTIDGRDLRGMMLDIPIATDPIKPEQVLAQLDLSKPINQVVRQLLDLMPYFSKLQIVVNPAEWHDNKIPAPGDAAAVPRHRLGAKGKKKGAVATPPGGSTGKASFWDIIVRLCYLVGAIPFFVRNELHIRPARGIFEQQGAGENPLQPTPFAGGLPRRKDSQSGKTIDGGPIRVRRLVYGRDTDTLTFDRKMGGYQRPSTVRVVSVDTSSTARGQKRMLQAEWPEPSKTKAKVTRVAPSNKEAMKEVLNIPVAGITDKAQLKNIAEAIYNEIGRGEVGGSCMTKNLSSFGGDNSDADMLRLRPGDGVEFGVDKRKLGSNSPLVSALTDFTRSGFEEQVRALKVLLGSENLARVVVATARGQVQELQRFFRVSLVHYSWDGSGVSIDFDFQNFIEVRADVAPVRLNPVLSTEKRLSVG